MLWHIHKHLTDTVEHTKILHEFAQAIDEKKKQYMIGYVTRSRKRDPVAKIFEIALLLPAHCAFYWELNSTKIAVIQASVAKIWLHLSQQLQNGGFEKKALIF